MKNEKYIDLHTHTVHSDGLLTPQQLITRASDFSISAVAITDHDTVDAHTPETKTFAKQNGVELVAGIEISTQDQHRIPYHILGLLIDTDNADLTTLISGIKTNRLAYTEKVLELLRDNLQLHVDEDTLLGQAGTVTKAHIARAVLGNEENAARLHTLFNGRIPTEGNFIESTLIQDKPAYVQRSDVILPGEAVEVIHSAQGLAVLAHPSFNVMRHKEEPEDIVKKAKGWNADGIEAINVQFDRSNNDEEVEHIDIFTRLATQHGLVISGGSDFHTTSDGGMGRVVDLGHMDYREKIPYTILDNLKSRKTSKHG